MSRRTLLLVLAGLSFALAVNGKTVKSQRRSEGVDIPCAGKKHTTMVGKLFSIQSGAREITIKFTDGTKEFRIASNCKMSTAEKPEAALTDLRLGTDVEVSFFTTKQGTDVACSVAPPSAAKKKPSK